MSLRLIEKLRLHADERPDAPAIRGIVPAGGPEWSWAELRSRVELLADFLRGHLAAGSTVILLLTNRPQYTAAFLAILDADMTVFPIAPDTACTELEQAARRSGAAAMIVSTSAQAIARDLVKLSQPVTQVADDVLFLALSAENGMPTGGPALLLLSSGTTGSSKIVRRDGASLDAVCANMVEAVGLRKSDCVLAAVPLCHSYGLEHGLLAPTWAGSTVHLCNGFDVPAVFAELAGARGAGCSVFPGVPFMFETLCAADGPAHLASLRTIYSAGAPLPRALYDAFLSRFKIPIAQLYGATEIGSVLYNDPSIDPFDPASVGRSMAGVSVRILDPDQPDLEHGLPVRMEGHVAVRAPSMLSGYVDDTEVPLTGGYFLTGDLGRLDATGALTITGRIKLLIDIGGRKVNPLEVEQVLATHPAVGECVVVSIRVSQTLNRLKAIVTPGPRGASPDAGDLRQFLRSRLSAYKIPRVFEVRRSLPRSALGKILRGEIEARELGNQ